MDVEVVRLFLEHDMRRLEHARLKEEKQFEMLIQAAKEILPFVLDRPKMSDDEVHDFMSSLGAKPEETSWTAAARHPAAIVIVPSDKGGYDVWGPYSGCFSEKLHNRIIEIVLQDLKMQEANKETP